MYIHFSETLFHLGAVLYFGEHIPARVILQIKITSFSISLSSDELVIFVASMKVGRSLPR